MSDQYNPVRVDNVESNILSLLADGTEPLYTVFEYVRRKGSATLELLEFARIVNALVQSGMVEVGKWDEATGELVTLDAIPPEAPAEYERQAHQDPRFDPLGLTLSLTPLASEFEEREWKLRIDWNAEEFMIRAERGAVEEAMSSASFILKVSFQVTHQDEVDGRIEIHGRIHRQQ